MKPVKVAGVGEYYRPLDYSVFKVVSVKKDGRHDEDEGEDFASCL